MASLTVDGKVFEAPAGAPLVEALKNNGIYTSNLCYIDGLKPYAGCRTCLVDVQGPPGLQLSCTSLVQDGMVVITESAEVKDARKAVLSLILANHSDRCLTCHRREHCHPGDICLRDDVVTHRCLTCSKNYRCELQATCEMVEMSGYEPWVGEERSFYQTPQPPADRGNPFMEFDPQMCIICTRCQRACEEKRHTGAITLSGRGWDTQIAFGAGGPIDESNCDFSGACIDVCPTAALMEHPNKWVAKADTWTTTTCDSCAVGCSIQLGSKEGRGVLVRPGDGNPVSGDQICVRGRYHYDSLKPRERLSKHLVRRGAIQAPATFAQAIEEAVKAIKEAAGKGKVGVLVGGTVTTEEAWLAAHIASTALNTKADSSLGPVMRAVRGALEQRLGTWRLGGDMTRIKNAKAIVVVADDIEESHNIASVRVKDACVHHGAKLVIIGSLRSELVDFASAWLRPAAGEEGQMAAALADALNGRPAVNTEIAAAAELLRGAPREETIVICAPNPVSAGQAGAMAGGAANIVTALFATAASENLVVLPAEVNVHGLQDVGVAVDGGANPLDGLAGLIVVRDDPTMRLPGAAEALANIPVIVAIDNVLSMTARQATVVVAEGRAYASSGTYTQGDFRVQKLSRAVQPEGDARALFDVLRALATGLGVETPSSPDAVLGEIARENPQYQPAHDLLVGQGIRMSVGSSGKAAMIPVAAPAANNGMRIATGRDLYTAADAAALRHPEAEKLHRYDRIQVSEEDAASMGIADGDEMSVGTGGNPLRAKVTVTERVARGSVFISSLFQGGAVSRLLIGDLLPVVTLAHVSAPLPRPPAGVVAPVSATEAVSPAATRVERVAPQRVSGRVANPVTRIKGVGPDWEARLEAEGIVTPADLLARAGDPEGRRSLAAGLGVPASQVLEWVNRADLIRVNGVGFAYSDLLEDAGVDTVKELSTRRADNLYRKLTEVAEADGRRAPTQGDVEEWVAEAKSLEVGVTH